MYWCTYKCTEVGVTVLKATYSFWFVYNAVITLLYETGYSRNFAMKKSGTKGTSVPAGTLCQNHIYFLCLVSTAFQSDSNSILFRDAMNMMPIQNLAPNSRKSHKRVLWRKQGKWNGYESCSDAVLASHVEMQNDVLIMKQVKVSVYKI
jgi:hypothetical protein